MNNGLPPKSGILGVVDTILTYVDQPWKAVAVIVALIVIGTGDGAWLERDFLQELLRPAPAAAILRNDHDLGAVIDKLFDGTGLEAVAIWSVDLGANVAHLRVARYAAGSPWKIPLPTIQWVTEQSDLAKVSVKLFHGEPACNHTGELHGALAHFLVQDGMEYVCYVPEPPSRTEAAVGMVLLAWKEKPDDALVRSALAAVLNQTNHIVMH
jgi:hypothetical protein